MWSYLIGGSYQLSWLYLTFDLPDIQNVSFSGNPFGQFHPGELVSEPEDRQEGTGVSH